MGFLTVSLPAIGQKILLSPGQKSEMKVMINFTVLIFWIFSESISMIFLGNIVIKKNHEIDLPYLDFINVFGMDVLKFSGSFCPK